MNERMLVGSLEQDGDAQRVLALLHKGELVFPEDVLVDRSGESQTGRFEVVEGVDGDASAGQGQTLHVAAFGAAKGQNALTSKGVEREGINA